MANKKSPPNAAKSLKAKATAQLSTATIHERAYAAGVAAANAALAQNRVAAAGMTAAGPPKGLLVAEGDSWFDYPGADVVADLEKLNWEVVSVAHHGDTIESMAFDAPQFVRLEKELRRLAEQKRTPRAILISGGGNDIAGDEFSMLLNHAASGLPAFNEKILEGVFEERLPGALISLAAGITRLCEELFKGPLPILVHGYGYPVPDGRGFLGGWSFLPGPWLEPGFRRKGYGENDLPQMTQLMIVLIDRFNKMLAALPASPNLGHLVYVDLRQQLSNTLPKKYKDDWANELHPTDKGFVKVAKLIDAAVP